MKEILISVEPQEADLILNGKNIVEVKKVPPIKPPFKLYIYCNKGKKGILLRTVYERYYAKTVPLNGSVVAKCVVNEIDYAKNILHLTKVEELYFFGLKHLEDFGIKKISQTYCYIKEKENEVY